jgi:hypothetical protein
MKANVISYPVKVGMLSTDAVTAHSHVLLNLLHERAT